MSDPAMEEAFFDTLLYQEFGCLPDVQFTILRFRHNLAEQILQTVNELLTERGLLLKVGTAIDAP